MYNLILANKRKIIVLLTLISGFACYPKTALANSITIEGNSTIKDSQINTEEYEGNVYEEYNFVPEESVQLGSYLPQVLTGHEKFINRSKELLEIERNLAGNQIVVITGRAGIGKSSCVIEYGRRYKDKSDKVACYINADSVSKIDQAYQEFAKELNINVAGQPPSMIMKLVHNKLVNLPKEILFIFDNVQQYDDIKDYLVNLPSNTRSLITTRQPKLIADVPNIALEEFDDEAAREYLKFRLQHRSFSDKDLQTIINNTGTLPYDLRYVSAQVLNNPLLDNQVVVAETGSKIKGKLFEELATSNDKVDRQAWKILQYAAYLDPDFIYIKIIKELFSQDEKLLSDSFKKLESLSLISIIIDKNDKLGLKIHRNLQKSIQYVIKNHSEYAMKEEVINDNLLLSLDKLFVEVDKNPDVKWQIASQLQPHVKKIIDSHLKGFSKKARISRATLCFKLSTYYTEINIDYKEALEYANSALMQMEALYTANNPYVVDVLNRIGFIYGMLGEPQKQLEYNQKALKVNRAVYSENNHPSTAKVLHGIGSAYDALGNTAEGLKYWEAELSMLQKLHSGDHPEIAESLSYIGAGYQDLGDVRKGLEYKRAGLHMNQRLYPNNHPSVAGSFNDVTYSYYKLGEYTKAIDYSRMAITIYEALYPESHPYTSYALHTLGASLIKTNNFDEGLIVLNKALDIARKFNMDKHFVAIFTYYDLGVGYFKKGDYNQALEYAEKALAFRQEIYASAKNHLEIVESLHSLGDIHLALGNRAKASEFYNEALAMSMTLSLDQLPETRKLQEKIKGLQGNK